MKYVLEYEAYQRFLLAYRATYHKNLRVGQAFYNHFQLHKMTSARLELDALYETDGPKAWAMIHELFNIVED